MHTSRFALAALLALAPVPAFAQDAAPAAPAGAPAAPTAPGGGPAVEDPTNFEGLPPGVDVHVIQKSQHTVTHSFEISPIAAFSLNNKYTSSIATGASVGFFFSEHLSVDLSFLYSFPSESGTTQNLNDSYSLTPPDAQRRQIKWLGAANVSVIPFYGKLALFGNFVLKFDFFITAGLGLVDTKVTDLKSLDPATGKPQILDESCTAPGANPVLCGGTMRLTGNFGTGFRVFFLDWLAMKLEFRDYIFSDVSDDGTGTGTLASDVRNTFYLMLGINFIL